MSLSVAMLSVHTSPLDRPGRTKDAGGMNVYMRELARELGQQNVAVDIYTRWTDPQAPQIVQLFPHVRVIHIEAGPVAPIYKNDLYRYLPPFVKGIEEFRGEAGLQYELLHSHYWLSSAAAMGLARRWDVPHVTMFHTLARLKQLANPDEPEPQLRLDTEQRLVQQVDRIIAATDEERSQIMRLYGATAQQVQVIPCGVDLTLFAPQERSQARRCIGMDTRGPILLFVGRLDPFKGPDMLLQAAAMMEEDAHIVMVGGQLSGDSDLQRLQSLARELHIDHRVHFMGARPQQELPMFYSAADVTVVPSYHESFGLVAVESLACGTPVVATCAGGLTTIVQQEKTGYLVPRCPGFFAGRLDTLLRNPDLLAHMQSLARRSVMCFSWEHVADKVHTLYENLLVEAHYEAAR